MPWQQRIFASAGPGATYLAEITACGLPAILIPYPFASENHQQYNAQSLVESGAAEMILDQALSGDTLYSALKPLIEEDDYRTAMAEKAAQAGNRDALNKL